MHARARTATHPYPPAAASPSAAAVTNSRHLRQLQRDVIVVGGGACGLVAALRVAELGGSVDLFERGSEKSGNTFRFTALIPAANTRFQREAGINKDTAERFADDVMASNGHQSDQDLTLNVAKLSGEVVEWLADYANVEIALNTDFLYPGHSFLRMHGPPGTSGRILSDQLWRKVRATKNIRVHLHTRVTSLLLDEDSSKVCGARIESGETFRAAAVHLATNGFGANESMVKKYLGDSVADNAFYFGSTNATGDGITWGQELGAELAHMGSYQGHASLVHPMGPLVTWGVVVRGAILVNLRGKRFGNELVGYSKYAKNVLDQPQGQAIEVFSESTYEACKSTQFSQAIAAGKVNKFHSVDALCHHFSLPTNAVEETLRHVNQCVDSGEVDTFGRPPLESRIDAPFYAVQVRGALFHTQGGLKIDKHSRALRLDGTTIRGLYAGGGTAAGLNGNGVEGYLSGNGLLTAVVHGFSAASHIMATEDFVSSKSAL